MKLQIEIDDLVAKIKQLHDYAYTNDLTGLPNRRALREFLDAGTSEESCIFALLDLDNFKYYNDTYGHEFGDEVLKDFAMLLKDLSMYDRARPYHISGDEFFIISTSLNILEFKDMLKVLKLKAGKIPVSTDDSLEFTFGIVHSHKDEYYSTSELLSKCDEAMYNNK